MLNLLHRGTTSMFAVVCIPTSITDAKCLVGNVLPVGTWRTASVGIQVILKGNATELTTALHVQGAIRARIFVTIRIQLRKPASMGDGQFLLHSLIPEPRASLMLCLRPLTKP